MITTRNIDAKAMQSKDKFKIKTTKDIDATLPYIKKPEAPAKKEMITTHNIESIVKRNRMAKARAARGKK